MHIRKRAHTCTHCHSAAQVPRSYCAGIDTKLDPPIVCSPHVTLINMQRLNSDPLRNTRTYVSKAVYAAQGEMECKQDFFEAVDLVVLGNGREVFMVNSPRRVPLSACIVVHGNADVNNSPWNESM